MSDNYPQQDRDMSRSLPHDQQPPNGQPQGPTQNGSKRPAADDDEELQGPAKRQATNEAGTPRTDRPARNANNALAAAAPLTPVGVRRTNGRRLNGRPGSASTNRTTGTRLAGSLQDALLLDDGEIDESSLPTGRGFALSGSQQAAPGALDYDGMPPPPGPIRHEQNRNFDAGRTLAPFRRPTRLEDVHLAMRQVLNYDKVRPGHIIKAAVYEKCTDHSPPTQYNQSPPSFCYFQGAHKPWILVKIRYLIVIAKHRKVFTCIPMFTRNGDGTKGLETRQEQYVSVKDWRWDGGRTWDETEQRWIDEEYQPQSRRGFLLAERMMQEEAILHTKSIAWLAYPVSMSRGMHGCIVGMLSRESFLALERHLEHFRIPAKKPVYTTWSGAEDGESFDEWSARDQNAESR